MNIKAAGELYNAGSGDFYIYSGEEEDAVVTVEEEGYVENDGDISISAGGSLLLYGIFSNSYGANFDMSGGQFTILTSGGFQNDGGFSVTGGTFDNQGYFLETTAVLSVIDAVNNYGTNIGIIAFDGEIDLSDVTLTGGQYSILGTATNDGDLVINSDTKLVNLGLLNWNDTDWSQYERVENRGDLYSSGMHQQYFGADDSWRDSFTSLFDAGLEATTDNGSTFDVSFTGGDSSPTGALNQGSTANNFTLSYNAGTETVALNIAGQTWIKSDVEWSGEGEDALFFTIATSGESPEDSGAWIRDLVLTPEGESAITLGDRVKYWHDEEGRLTVGIYGTDMREGFEMEGTLEADFDEDGDLDVHVEGGTFQITTGVAHDISPSIRPNLKDGTIFMLRGGAGDKPLTIAVTAGGLPSMDDVEIIGAPRGVAFSVSGAGPTDGIRTVTCTAAENAFLGWHDVRIQVVGDPGAYAIIRICVKLGPPWE